MRKLVGNVDIDVTRTDGTVTQIRWHNLITRAGINILLNNLGGSTAKPVTSVMFGSGTNDVTLGDTSLTAPTYLLNFDGYAEVVSPDPFAVIVEFSGTLSTAAQVYTELGTFTSDGTLFSRCLLPDPLYLDAGDAVAGRWYFGYDLDFTTESDVATVTLETFHSALLTTNFISGEYLVGSTIYEPSWHKPYPLSIDSPSDPTDTIELVNVVFYYLIPEEGFDPDLATDPEYCKVTFPLTVTQSDMLIVPWVQLPLFMRPGSELSVEDYVNNTFSSESGLQYGIPRLDFSTRAQAATQALNSHNSVLSSMEFEALGMEGISPPDFATTSGVVSKLDAAYPGVSSIVMKPFYLYLGLDDSVARFDLGTLGDSSYIGVFVISARDIVGLIAVMGEYYSNYYYGNPVSNWFYKWLYVVEDCSFDTDPDFKQTIMEIIINSGVTYTIATHATPNKALCFIHGINFIRNNESQAYLNINDHFVSGKGGDIIGLKYMNVLPNFASNVQAGTIVDVTGEFKIVKYLRSLSGTGGVLISDTSQHLVTESAVQIVSGDNNSAGWWVNNTFFWYDALGGVSAWTPDLGFNYVHTSLISWDKSSSLFCHVIETPWVSSTGNIYFLVNANTTTDKTVSSYIVKYNPTANSWLQINISFVNVDPVYTNLTGHISQFCLWDTSNRSGLVKVVDLDHAYFIVKQYANRTDKPSSRWYTVVGLCSMDLTSDSFIVDCQTAGPLTQSVSVPYLDGYQISSTKFFWSSQRFTYAYSFASASYGSAMTVSAAAVPIASDYSSITDSLISVTPIFSSSGGNMILLGTIDGLCLHYVLSGLPHVSVDKSCKVYFLATSNNYGASLSVSFTDLPGVVYNAINNQRYSEGDGLISSPVYTSAANRSYICLMGSNGNPDYTMGYTAVSGYSVYPFTPNTATGYAGLRIYSSSDSYNLSMLGPYYFPFSDYKFDTVKVHDVNGKVLMLLHSLGYDYKAIKSDGSNDWSGRFLYRDLLLYQPSYTDPWVDLSGTLGLDDIFNVDPISSGYPNYDPNTQRSLYTRDPQGYKYVTREVYGTILLGAYPINDISITDSLDGTVVTWMRGDFTGATPTWTTIPTLQGQIRAEYVLGSYTYWLMQKEDMSMWVTRTSDGITWSTPLYLIHLNKFTNIGKQGSDNIDLTTMKTTSNPTALEFEYITSDWLMIQFDNINLGFTCSAYIGDNVNGWKANVLIKSDLSYSSSLGFSNNTFSTYHNYWKYSFAPHVAVSGNYILMTFDPVGSVHLRGTEMFYQVMSGDLAGGRGVYSGVSGSSLFETSGYPIKATVTSLSYLSLDILTGISGTTSNIYTYSNPRMQSLDFTTVLYRLRGWGNESTVLQAIFGECTDTMPDPQIELLGHKAPVDLYQDYLLSFLNLALIEKATGADIFRDVTPQFRKWINKYCLPLFLNVDEANSITNALIYPLPSTAWKDAIPQHGLNTLYPHAGSEICKNYYVSPNRALSLAKSRVSPMGSLPNAYPITAEQIFYEELVRLTQYDRRIIGNYPRAGVVNTQVSVTYVPIPNSNLFTDGDVQSETENVLM